MMKMVDTGLCYDRMFAFIGTSLKSLYLWTPSCTLIPQPHRSCLLKEGVAESNKTHEQDLEDGKNNWVFPVQLLSVQPFHMLERAHL